MSLNEINNNTTFDYLPSEIRVNKSINFQNPNVSTISLSRKSPLIYSTGVDDYVFNEIKKAKYQGCFDPGSLGNKNIFNDTHNYRVNTETNRKSSLKKTYDKNKKYSNITNSHRHKHDEGKNLLIEKSEIQYPLKFDKSTYMLTNNNKRIRKFNKSIEYSYNTSPNTIKRHYNKSKFDKNKTNIYNYYTPMDNDRKNKIEKSENQNRIIVKNSLMNNYNENSRLMNKTRNNKYSKNITDKVFDSDILSFNRENFFSPIIFPNRNSVYETHNISKNKQLYDTINVIDTNNDENLLKYSYNVIKNSDINNTNDEEYENLGNVNFNDDENENDNTNQKEIKVDNDNEDIKLINKYRKKLLYLFFMHMGNFYIMHYKIIFRDFIVGLKNIVKNKKYKFENKTIMNIQEIKKNLITNSYYYGHNKQYTSLLKDIKNKKNSPKVNINNKTNNNKHIFNDNKKYLETDYQNIEKNSKTMKNLIKKRYIINNKQIINKETIIKNKEIKITKINNKDEIISNKKYTKKNISKGIFTRSKPEIKYLKKEIAVKNINFNNKNKLIENNSQEDRKIIKSVDGGNKTSNNSINKNKIKYKKILTSYNSSTITVNRNNEIKPKLFKKTLPNSKNIKNKAFNISKKNEKNKLDNNSNLLTNIIIEKNYLLNEQNNNFQLLDISGEKTLDEKINMNFKYLEINKNKLKRNKNDINNKNYKIENAFKHSFFGKEINEFDLDENENNDEINSMTNNNLQNAISIITKIIENKEKDEEIKNIRNSLLSKIIHNKINKDNKQQKEIVKKYFYLMKPKNMKIGVKYLNSKKKMKYSIDLAETSTMNKVPDKLKLEKKILNSDNEELDNSEKEKNEETEENNEENLSSSRSRKKFRIVIKRVKIHKSFTKNILDSKIKRLKPIKSAKNCLPLIPDINDVPSRNILKKTISISVNRKNKSLSKENINKNKLREIIENKDEKQNINLNIEDNKEKQEIYKENNKEEKQELNNGKKAEEKIKINIEDEKEGKEKINLEDQKEENNVENDEKNNHHNLSINNDILKIDNIITNSEKNIYRNFKLIKKPIILNDFKRKSLVDFPKYRRSIESFTQYRKKKSKLNKSKNESVNEGDITLYEKYQDYENLIYYLRTQLIFCFINNSKNNEPYND